jgi:hypothetical protein
LGETVSAAQLTTFDAATLFVARARTAQPNLVVDDAAAVQIAAICSRLDGIPLAIELAAARSRTLSLERMATGLDDAFRLLTGGARTLMPRQQTLRESVRWSFDLLDETEGAVLRRLSVCPTVLDLDAAEAVAADGEIVAATTLLDALGRLVDKGLAEFDEVNDRYRMLGTIRQYGLERLRDAGEIEDTRRRYAEYWSDQAIRLGQWGPTLDYPALRDVLTDVVVMLDWSMTEDPDMADRVLGATAINVYGLGRWPDFERACDFVVADRPRGRHWPHAVGEVAVLAPFIKRFDVWGLVVRRWIERSPTTTPTRCICCGLARRWRHGRPVTSRRSAPSSPTLSPRAAVTLPRSPPTLLSPVSSGMASSTSWARPASSSSDCAQTPDRPSRTWLPAPACVPSSISQATSRHHAVDSRRGQFLVR